MTEDRMAPIEAIQKADDGDFTPALAETVPRIIMDSDIEALVGVGRHERADRRLTYRNGYRDRILETRLGALNPRIAKLRQGSYVPGCTADASPAFCCTQPGQIEHPVHPGQHIGHSFGSVGPDSDDAGWQAGAAGAAGPGWPLLHRVG